MRRTDMLKGKELYRAAREFTDETLLPELAEDEETQTVKAAELGIALLVDVAESLHRIAVKVG
jgi:hypothetical protein